MSKKQNNLNRSLSIASRVRLELPPGLAPYRCVADPMINSHIYSCGSQKIFPAHKFAGIF